MSTFPDVPGYRITGELGRGGFAVVYRAEQLSLRRQVALKVLSVLDLTDDEVARFTRECATLAELDWHPNILRILDTGLTSEGRPYLSMELLDAGSVGARHLGSPAPIDTVIDLGIQISGALAAAHTAGILHRDVKPANILIDRTGRYRLADFGIASIVGSTRSSSTGMAGTVGYLAPELILGKKATAASDVYSLAATMHALVTGVPPFSRPTDETAAAAIARTLHEPAADLRPFGAPEWFAAAIERALDKDPDRRFANAEEFGKVLESRGAALPPPVVAPASSTPPPPDAPTVRKGAAPAAATGVAAATVVTAGSAAEATVVRRAEPSTHQTPPPPADDATVLAKRWPAAPIAVPANHKGRRTAVIAAAIVTLLGITVGVSYAARGGDDDEAAVPGGTSATEAIATTSTSDGAANAATTTTAVGDTVTSTIAGDTAPPSTLSTSTVPGETLPAQPLPTVAGTVATTVPRTPAPGAITTTTQVASLPVPAGTVATTPTTPTPTATPTTRPPTTAAPVTAAPVTAAPVTTARPVVTTTTAAPGPRYPNPQVRTISYSNVGTSYTFVADADRCQQYEQWSFSGPTGVGPFAGSYPNWQCWDRAHSRTVTLTPGTWTVTLTLTGNGVSDSASVTVNVPQPAPQYPNPQVRTISYSNVGSTYTFVADADRCQQYEQWSFSGPTGVGPFAGSYPNWQCWDRAHSRTVDLSPGTWTVTLTLSGNGVSDSASVTVVVP